jgi:hypothetical protein
VLVLSCNTSLVHRPVRMVQGVFDQINRTDFLFRMHFPFSVSARFMERMLRVCDFISVMTVVYGENGESVVTSSV